MYINCRKHICIINRRKQRNIKSYFILLCYLCYIYCLLHHRLETC